MISSDHRMPFPFVKGQIHEDGFHLPLAMRWGAGIKPGAWSKILSMSATSPPPISNWRDCRCIRRCRAAVCRRFCNRTSQVDRGRSQRNAGWQGATRRRPTSRLGLPVRAIRTPEYLYVHNFFPEPAGRPATRKLTSPTVTPVRRRNCSRRWVDTTSTCRLVNVPSVSCTGSATIATACST